MGKPTRREFLYFAATALAGVSCERANAGIHSPRVSYDSRLYRKYLLEGIERESITITDIRVTPLSYVDPNRYLWFTSDYITWKTDALLVEVFTDKGVVGIGEGSPSGAAEQVKQYIEERVKSVFIGENPFDVELLTCGGINRIKSCAWAGVTAACLDIIGKVKNMPVYKLLSPDNKPDPHIRIYASGGVNYAWYDRPDDLIDEGIKLREQGFTAFKFRPGTDWKYSNMTVKKFIPYLYKLREAVGPTMDLICETRPWSLAEALELAPVLEELHFLWFESPLGLVRWPDEVNMDEYLQLKEALPTVMVSGCELMPDKHQFKEWIDRGVLDIVQPDCGIVGITEAWHISRMAHKKGILCCSHNWYSGLITMQNAHLEAAIPNRVMLELNQTYNPLKEDIFKEPLVVKNGYMDLPDKPGFGLELIDNIAKKFPYVPGSFTQPNPVIKKGQ